MAIVLKIKTIKRQIKCLVWRPKIRTLYKPKSKTKWSLHDKYGEGCGYSFDKITKVRIIDKMKRQYSGSFYIHKDGNCEIRIKHNQYGGKKKKKMFYPKNKLKFKKRYKYSAYWGQGGGTTKMYTYTVYIPDEI